MQTSKELREHHGIDPASLTAHATTHAIHARKLREHHGINAAARIIPHSGLAAHIAAHTTVLHCHQHLEHLQHLHLIVGIVLRRGRFLNRLLLRRCLAMLRLQIRWNTHGSAYFLVLRGGQIISECCDITAHSIHTAFAADMLPKRYGRMRFKIIIRRMLLFHLVCLVNRLRA